MFEVDCPKTKNTYLVAQALILTESSLGLDRGEVLDMMTFLKKRGSSLYVEWQDNTILTTQVNEHLEAAWDNLISNRGIVACSFS